MPRRTSADDMTEDETVAAEPQPQVEPQTQADLSGLIKMHKDGKVIHAHPDVVKEHQKNGWKPA